MEQTNGTGWIKLHRKVLNSEQWQDDIEWRLFMGCLLLATSKPVDVVLKSGAVVHLEPGQFLTSRRRLWERLYPSNSTGSLRGSKGVSESALWRLVLRLANEPPERRWLNLEVNRDYSVITICNWARYQLRNGGSEPANEPAARSGSEPENEPDQEFMSCTHHGTKNMRRDLLLDPVHTAGSPSGSISCSEEIKNSPPAGEKAKRAESIALAEHCRALGAELPAWWARQLDWAFANGVTLAEAKSVVKRHPDLVLDPKKLCAELIRQHREARFDRSAKYVEYNPDGSIKKDWM